MSLKEELTEIKSKISEKFDDPELKSKISVIVEKLVMLNDGELRLAPSKWVVKDAPVFPFDYMYLYREDGRAGTPLTFKRYDALIGLRVCYDFDFGWTLYGDFIMFDDNESVRKVKKLLNDGQINIYGIPMDKYTEFMDGAYNSIIH
jgi:hypothetical protein